MADGLRRSRRVHEGPREREQKHHEQRPDGTRQMPEVGIVIPAHACALGKALLAFAVPTLELKISFLDPAGPGFVIAEGRVLRWGGSVGFLDGDIKDDKGRVIVHATSTIKIVRPRK